MNNPLGVSPIKGNQGTTRGKEKKKLLTSVGIEPTTSGLDLPLLWRLSYEVGQSNGRSESSLRRRANAQNVSSRISLRWPIHIIN